MNHCKVVLACISVVAVASAASVSCSKKNSSSSTSGSGGTMKMQFASSKLTTAAMSDAMALLDQNVKSGLSLSSDRSSILGESTPESFTSAKYRVSRMELCGKAKTTDDSCEERPWSLYSEELSDNSAYDSFVPSVAKSFTGWTDFLDKDSTAKLASSATYSDYHVGTYDSVFVYFYRAFAIKASIPMSDGSTIYTKSSETFRDNGKSGLDVTYENVANGKLKTAPAEEAIMFLPNGGKKFLLPRSFEITADDLSNKTSFKMVLAYDPNGIIKGSGIYIGESTGTNTWLDGQVDRTNGYKIQAPFMEFSPVVARESETIMKESYLLTSDGDSTIPASKPGPKTPFAVRLTLYYVKEDSTKSIRGVTTADLLRSTSTSLPPATLSGIRKVVENSDGTLNFINASESVPLLKNFKRIAKGTVGTVTSTICNGGMSSEGCEVASDGSKSVSELTFSYTLIGESEVSEALTVSYTPTPTPTATP